MKLQEEAEAGEVAEDLCVGIPELLGQNFLHFKEIRTGWWLGR